jgi:hypothetical protein
MARVSDPVLDCTVIREWISHWKTLFFEEAVVPDWPSFVRRADSAKILYFVGL